MGQIIEFATSAVAGEVSSPSEKLAMAYLDEARLTEELKSCKCTNSTKVGEDRYMNCLTHHFTLKRGSFEQMENVKNLCEPCVKASKIINLRVAARARKKYAEGELSRWTDSLASGGMSVEVEQEEASPITLEDALNSLKLANSYNRMNAVLGLLNLQSKDEWLKTLGEEWANCDNISDHRSQLRSLLGTEGPVRAMMTPEENAAYDALPDQITCYAADIIVLVILESRRFATESDGRLR